MKFKLNVTWNIRWTKNLQIKSLGFSFQGNTDCKEQFAAPEAFDEALCSSCTYSFRRCQRTSLLCAHYSWDLFCNVFCEDLFWQFLLCNVNARPAREFLRWSVLLCSQYTEDTHLPVVIPRWCRLCFPTVWFINLHKEELAEFQLEVVLIGKKEKNSGASSDSAVDKDISSSTDLLDSADSVESLLDTAFFCKRQVFIR